MMLKFLTHPVAKAAFMMLGFIASFNWVRSVNNSFNFYVSRIVGPLYFSGYVRIFAIPVFIISIAILLYGVWHTRSKTTVLHKLDVSLIFLLCICLFAFGTRVTFMQPFSIYIIFFLPVFAYLSIVFLLVQTVLRIRDNSLTSTLYWWRFFGLQNVFVAKIAMGVQLTLLLAILFTECLSMIGLLTGNRILMFASVFWMWGWTLSSVVIVLICIALFFCALNFFASFVLGLSAQYTVANAEKLRSERFKAELITNVSHDIRTPLTSIINYTHLLKKLELQGEAASYIDVLDKKAIRLKQLLSDLIDASQASTGAIKMDIQPLDIIEMLGQVTGEFSDIFDERGLTIILRQPDLPLYVMADSRHLFRAMENIFSNAAKYSLPGTRVFAEIETALVGVVFTLRNTSANLIDTPAETLTEQFIRGDLARHSEGSGLGLHIAKSLVEHMHGNLTIRLRGDAFEVVIFLPSL